MASFFAKRGAAAGGGGGASSSSAAPPSRVVPWVEKFRPKNVEDISSQEDIVKSLKNAVISGNVPHMLFYGPPGTGKTSTILAMARDMYGPELMRTRVMELNASDERGIQVVREKVKNFAMGSVSHVAGAPPYKLIILDEADSLTADAQAALRRTMETFSRVTRFCIICNYVSRIIEPLASRCSKYRFKPLGREAMATRLRLVCDSEGVDAGDDTLHAVLDCSGGDMRKAITFLQSASQLYGGSIKPENVVEISGAVPPKALDAFYTAVKRDTSSFDGARRAAQVLLLQGYSMSAIFDRLVDKVVTDAELSAVGKASVCERLACADKKLADGADEELQLVDIAACILRAHRGITVPADSARSYL